MPGLYVHVPFCARRCPYCDFAIKVGAPAELVRDYVAALKRELETVLDEHARNDGRAIETIFFGGGTPTFLDGEVLAGILKLIFERAEIAPDAEISTEANPDGLTEEKLSVLRRAGWNRISLGAQSFDDEALEKIGRTHRAADIERVVATARGVGFQNISLDLMFALPGQSRASWRETLRRAIDLEPQHLSCYSLTIEDETPFARRVARGQLLPMADDDQADLMNDAEELTGAAGIERYEVSNYARGGFACRHNLNYWRGGDYLAVGCGAHGHRNGHRWWNERDARRYVQLMNKQGSARGGEEFLSPCERLNEIVMLGLRLCDGFSLDETSRKLGFDAARELNGRLEEMVRNGKVRRNSGVLSCPALALADGVAARLMS